MPGIGSSEAGLPPAQPPSKAMKRATTSSENPPPKRTKASQACTSCRKQKSRCEILEVRPTPGVPIIIRCHRCKTLNAQCSFETSELIHFSPKTILHTSPAVPSPAAPTLTTSESRDGGAGLSTLAAVASARPNVAEAPLNHISGSFRMRPEDLVPTATTPIWGSVSRVDWTATPMLAIQELARCPRTDTGVQLPSADRLSDILSPTEITSLLEVFVFSLHADNLADFGTQIRNSICSLAVCSTGASGRL